MGRYVYKYPMPSATVDLAAMIFDAGTIRVLMIRREVDPFAGRWAFPGGFVEIDESFDDAARREMKEETGLQITGPLSFIGVFGQPGRDPRGRTISIAHSTVLRGPFPVVKGSDDASEARWLAVNETHGLAFDHDLILASALAWLSRQVKAGPVGLGLLPERFAASDVRLLHDAVFGHDRDARRWLARLLKTGQARRSPTDGVYVARSPKTEPTRYAEPFHRDDD